MQLVHADTIRNLDTQATVVIIDDNFAVGIEPGGINNVDNTEIGRFKVAGVEDVAVFRVALGGDSCVFSAAVAAGSFDLSHAVFQSKSLPVNVKVERDGVLTNNGGGIRFAFLQFADRKPAGALLNSGLKGEFSFSNIVNGHLNGIGAGSPDDAAANNFQRGASYLFRNGFSGKFIQIGSIAAAVVGEETETRINVFAIAVIQIKTCDHIFTKLHF